VTKIILNGREVEADASKPLIHACHQNDEQVPHYCYHPGLTPVGSCRICQVEVKQGQMPARVVVACRTPIAEGMIVNTESDGAHAARKECLEFLLKNHPLDCPICDKAGECTLQDYSFDEGQGQGRSSEPRRKLEKRKDLGDVIVLDQERCILCSRCVRFMEEIPKSPQLAVVGRGAHSVIETFADRPLEGNYQGNQADVCPVGALTLKPFRFQARVWNLEKTASTCGECSRGGSTTVELLRSGEVKRIRPRENSAVNAWWMCDTGRFAYEPLTQVQRLAGAVLRNSGGDFEACDTATALETARDMLLMRSKPLLVLSPFLTIEEGAAAIELATAIAAATVFVAPAANELADEILHTGDPCPNRRGLSELGIDAIEVEALGARFEAHDAVLFIGDRIDSLVGAELLAQLTPVARVLFITTTIVDVAASDVCIGMPNQVERTGTWVNIDGQHGALNPARHAPQGVWQLTRTLASLTQSCSSAEVKS
jgi:NADH-quinone oxidoreductase subunit G